MRRSARLRQQQQQHQEVDTAHSPAQRPQRPPKPGKRRAASPTPTKRAKRRASAAVVASPSPPPQAPTADQAPKERDPPLPEAPDKELAPEMEDTAAYPLGDVSHAMVDALFQLGNLDDLIIDDPTVAIDPNAAQSALNLNERMQTLVRKQIDAIHKRILKNDEAMKRLRALSFREARLRREKTDVHRPYDDQFAFFVGKDGETPDTEAYKEREESTLDTERPRAWHLKERQMLAEGIHHEAQRKIAYEHMARQEPWRVWEVDKLPESILEKYPVNKLDWERISTQYVKTRTPLECMIQWTTQDHPSINKLPWSKVETERLGQLVQTHGYHGQWEKIASELNTNRTAAQCFSHYQFASNTKAAHKKWTKDDDDALRNAVTVLGDRNWQQVATLVGGRSGQQCLHRWLKSINPAIRRSKWTDEEDQALRGAVAVYGIGNWTSVQRHIPGRTDMQCRERWVNVLDSSLNHGPFSDDEKAKLIALIDQHGKKWSHIAQFMPGRTDNSLLRMWASMERAKKKEEKANQKKKDEANATTSKDAAMKNEKKTAMRLPTSSSSKKKSTASSASSTKSKAKGKAKA